jgi:hypothetical protein
VKIAMTKFKYKGKGRMVPFDLIMLNVWPRGEKLKKGDIIEIPNDHPQKDRIIASMRKNGLFEEVGRKKRRNE